MRTFILFPEPTDFGACIAFVDDVDNDGKQDVAVGSPGDSTIGQDAGRVDWFSTGTGLWLRTAYGALPDATDSDGVVPTLSQLHGTVLHATLGDHLDVIGHFGDATRTPPHFDWLVTGSGFDHDRFVRVWSAVADHLSEAPPASGGRSAESRP